MLCMRAKAKDYNYVTVVLLLGRRAIQWRFLFVTVLVDASPARSRINS